MKHVLQLVGRDRQVLTAAHPRADDVAQSSLLEHLLQSSDAAHLGAIDVAENGGESRGVFRLLRSQTAGHGENFIQESHENPLSGKIRRSSAKLATYFCLAMIWSLILL